MDLHSDLLVIASGAGENFTASTQMVTDKQGQKLVDIAKAERWPAKVVAINIDGKIVAEHYPPAPKLDELDC